MAVAIYINYKCMCFTWVFRNAGGKCMPKIYHAVETSILYQKRISKHGNILSVMPYIMKFGSSF